MAGLDKLYLGPGFLIRRAHQIASAAFAEACGDLDLTQSQYSVLFVLRHRGPLSQNELGRLVWLDRCTTSVVVRLLKERGLLKSVPHPEGRRRILLSLTDAGRQVFVRAERATSRAARGMLSAFDRDESKSLIELLSKLVADLDGQRHDLNSAEQ